MQKVSQNDRGTGFRDVPPVEGESEAGGRKGVREGEGGEGEGGGGGVRKKSRTIT